MKKIMCLLAVACLIFIACDPVEEITTRDRLYWDVTNKTSQELYVHLEDQDKGFEIKPDESVRIYQFNLKGKDDQQLSFDLFVQNSEQAKFTVYGEKNGKVLKSWSHAQRDEPGKQFYREDSWTLTIDSKEGTDDRYYWLFNITTDDIE